LNRAFKEQNLKPIEILEADAHQLSEDILELINSGVVRITVVDDYKAKIWAKVLPDIQVLDSVAIKRDTNIGWGIRKNNPELKKSLDSFLQKVKKGTLLGNMLFNRYYKKDKWIKNPNAREERSKLLALIDVFKKYGDQYGFDYLAIAAQAYQESQLEQSRRSHRGAIGIMQLLPSTAADKNVGIPDISKAEDNIQAGVKYLAFMRDRYFSDPKISEEDRMAFSWAAYNAGPAKLRKMRNLTKKMGLNPNVWHSNVEVAAGKIVGRETVEYVSNIFKYYIAYRLVHDQRLSSKSDRKPQPD
jgi:membrane-bound lytic murein transglycosylase MltF